MQCEQVGKVFPACAGVIRNSHRRALSSGRFPRMRGGDPGYFDAISETLGFSPHARG